jgi:hypothetical protein
LAPGWRTADRGVEELPAKTVAGATASATPARATANPRITTQVRNRGALAPGLMRIG